MNTISPQLRQALIGISGILVTPFDQNNRVQASSLEPIVHRAVEAGVDILVVNGNTSEYYALREQEALYMMQAVAEMTVGKVPVVNGVGRSIGEACDLAKASKRAGVDAIMVHQPPDPFVAPRGVIDYVERIADAADGLPLMLYLRNDAIGLDAITRLTAIPGVAGVKWATPNMLKLGQAIRNTDPSVVWVCGLAETWAPPMYAMGAQGFTSGLINIWPARSVEILNTLRAGDYSRARALIAEIEDFEAIRAEEMNGTNVTGVKAALQILGQDCGPARAPAAWPLTLSQYDRLATLLNQLGLTD